MGWVDSGSSWGASKRGPASIVRLVLSVIYGRPIFQETHLSIRDLVFWLSLLSSSSVA